MSQKILTDSFQVFDTAELVFKRLVFYPKIYPLDIGQSQSKDFFFSLILETLFFLENLLIRSTRE